MSIDPKGFEENPQIPLSAEDDDEENIIDETVFGAQKVLTLEEQANYDEWLRRKVKASLDYSKRPDAVFHTHDEVMQNVDELLRRLDREAGIK